MDRTGKTGQTRTGAGPNPRAERLKAALKANIARRKAQAATRGAAAGAGTDTKTDGPQG
jgi:hypothetical protein